MFESLETIANGVRIFTKDCIEGLTVNKDVCTSEIEKSIGIVTSLCPFIGYTKAAKIAKQALRENKNVRDILIEEKILSESELNELLDPKKMI